MRELCNFVLIKLLTMTKKNQTANAESGGIRGLFKTYVVDALSYMAMGLFASLIIGLIIKQIALIPGLGLLAPIATIAQLDLVVGGAIGLAIALGLKRDPLVTISAVAVGALGYTLGGPAGDVGGNPIGAYLATIVAIEIGSLVTILF